MVFVLFLIVGIIYGIFFFIKKNSRIKFQSDLIRIYAAQVVSGNKVLYLVGVHTHIYLLAISESGVHLISELTDKESKDIIITQTGESVGVKRGFAQLLSRVLKTSKKTSSEDIQESFKKVDEKVQFFREQKDKLEDL